MAIKFIKCRVFIFVFILCSAYNYPQNSPEHDLIISVERIWDRAAHNAFTSLIDFNGKLYCTFRESSGHVSDINGTIRVIRSDDGQNWKSVAHIFERGIDLRDPQLSITPDNRIMLNMGGSIYTNSKLVGMEPKVSFSNVDGQNFSNPQRVFIDDKIKSNKDWLWRATWNNEICYATIYQPSKDKSVQLIKSKDGIHYSYITTFEVLGGNETTLRFTPDNKMVAVVRRDNDKNGSIGISEPPYNIWKWNNLEVRLGGPDLIVLKDGTMLCATREYPLDHNERTIIGKVDVNGIFTKLLTLPSGGDCSYPGLLMKDSILNVSYYSSHEEKTAIYLAKIVDLKYGYNSYERVPKPYISFDKNGIIKLSCEDSKAKVRYTLDGSMPTADNSYNYTEPIQIGKTTLLRAISTRYKYPASTVLSQNVGIDIYQESRRIDKKLENGLMYAYYEGEVKSTKLIDKLSIIKSGIVSKVETVQRNRDVNYALIFNGYIKINEDGVYTFYLSSNDGSILYINDELAINNDGAHGKREESGMLSLRQGFHKIELSYFQLGGGHELTLQWEGLKFEKVEIPKSVFFH